MDTQTLVTLLVVISLSYAPFIWRTIVNNRKLSSIPTVGASGYLTSYIGALQFTLHAREMVQEGYDKFHGSIFKVPTLKSWKIGVSDRQKIDDIRRAGDDVLSAMEALKESLSMHITIGPEHTDDPFHIEVIGGPLTRNIGARFSDIQDEISLGFNDNIPFKGKEWVEVIAYETIMNIVCRASNRILVGLPLCRDPDWIDLNKNFTIDVIKVSLILGVFPLDLRRYIAPLFRSIPRGIKRGVKHLEPLIRERLKKEEEHGEDWTERPNDVITWIFEMTKGEQRKMRELVICVLLINVAAIHTTTVAFTHVIFELATRPEYVEPLRKEVEAIINEEGWSRDSARNLWKMDSFIKETMRLSDFLITSMDRKVLKDFTFSDGTTIPAGNTVFVPFCGVHTDPEIYTDPGVFDGFRFEKMRQQGDDLKHQMVSLDLDYVLFGNGRHACPGRFFATNELKIMLAHVLLNYDIKMADGKGRPENQYFGIHTSPDTTAKVMFRKRRV